MNNCTILTNRLILNELTTDNVKDLTKIALNNAKLTSEFLVNYLKENINSYNEELIKRYGIEKLLKYTKNNEKEIADEDLFSFFGNTQYPFRESSKGLIKKAIEKRNEEQRSGYYLGIYLKERPTKLIGIFIITSKLFETKSGTRTGYFGYMIDTKFQRNGYITEAKSAIFDLFLNYILKSDPLFNEKTVLYATAHPLNFKSDLLQKKFGAQMGNEIINPNSLYGSRVDYFFHQDSLNNILNGTENNEYIAIINNIIIKKNNKILTKTSLNSCFY